MESLQRIGVKFFVRQPDAVDLAEFVPVFHRFIQTDVLDGLLIDVADYRHVHHGPGLMLIAHEGNYAMDLAGGRPGLQYLRKQALAGSLAERLCKLCRITLSACREIEEAPELCGKIRFAGEQLEVVANDRLRAPNSEATAASLRTGLDAFAVRLYGDRAGAWAAADDARDLFRVNMRAAGEFHAVDLLAKLGS